MLRNKGTLFNFNVASCDFSPLNFEQLSLEHTVLKDSVSIFTLRITNSGIALGGSLASKQCSAKQTGQVRFFVLGCGCAEGKAQIMLAEGVNFPPTPTEAILVA